MGKRSPDSGTALIIRTQIPKLGNRARAHAHARARQGSPIEAPWQRSGTTFEDEVLPADEDVACARPADAAAQYRRSIRAWVDEGSAKVPLACKPSELEAWLARAGTKPPSFRRCTTDTRAELNCSNLHAGRVCSPTPRRSCRGGKTKGWLQVKTRRPAARFHCIISLIVTAVSLSLNPDLLRATGACLHLDLFASVCIGDLERSGRVIQSHRLDLRIDREGVSNG